MNHNDVFMEMEYSMPKWHVVYTRPRSEKKVALNFEMMGIEGYLPLHKTVKQWSDRKKKVEVPLFPNYVFVKIDTRRRGELFSIKEMVKFVSIAKIPVIVAEDEIQAIKKVLNHEIDVSVVEYCRPGVRVRVKYGPFAGLEGIVESVNGKSRLIVKIDGLMKAFGFNISMDMVEILSVRPMELELRGA